jgi:RNA polymerase sigma-70 factor, ECF subfamily
MSQFARIHIEPHSIEALKRGDRAAAETIYRALADVVYTLAARILGDTQLAREVTQDTFVDVIERAATLQSDGAFVAWVRSIATNHCLMRLRSPWRRRRDRNGMIEAADAGSDVVRLDGISDIERALARLSAETRFVVWMHDVEGYTHVEIGRLVGRSESYSKSQLARGHARLLAWQKEVADDATDIIAAAP